MAELTGARRNKLSASDFGLPDKRAYPMPDKAHARNAKARAAEELKKHNLTEAEYDKIVRKANKILYGTTAVSDTDNDHDTA